MWWPFKKKPITKIEKKEEESEGMTTQTVEQQVKSLKVVIKDLEKDNQKLNMDVGNLQEQVTRLTKAVEFLRDAMPSLTPNRPAPTTRR